MVEIIYNDGEESIKEPIDKIILKTGVKLILSAIVFTALFGLLAVPSAISAELLALAAIGMFAIDNDLHKYYVNTTNRYHLKTIAMKLIIAAAMMIAMPFIGGDTTLVLMAIYSVLSLIQAGLETIYNHCHKNAKDHKRINLTFIGAYREATSPSGEPLTTRGEESLKLDEQ
ncbi:MAG: hypothetical protein JKY19_00075 [Alcanivoracaceae bacterium]|nr:hypothetical protein [Alcanivoracaceae bacterium]